MTVNQQHEQEKRWVALTSLLAAVGITAFKLVVGLLTGSLGILAEAAHSGLDLVAAAATFWSIRISGRPADREHPFGHGKVENLSALFQVVLLFVTCIWIFYEAAHRIMPHSQAKIDELEVTYWSYLVMITSIVVDYSRSKALSRAAKKHNSQALEADALHFSTDIWSSTVVILGLICVSLSDIIKGADFLHYADSLAAIAVALIVVQVSLRLGMQTVNSLLDSAPEGLSEKVIAATEKIPGIVNCHHVRIRSSGAQVFVDLHVMIDGNVSLKDAHRLTHVVEGAIREIEPSADVTVHPEPH